MPHRDLNPPSGRTEPPTLLKLVDLTTRFYVPDGVVRAVEGVDFEVRSGEVVAVVGESGSGKSVMALSAMRLIAEPPGKIERGKVLFHGEDLLTKTRSAMQSIRGRRISMIFQNPFAALNPLIKIGDQLRETLNKHRDVTRRQASAAIEESLARLGIAEPRRVLKNRPYQTSGGMAQRVMLALALLGEPELLIADEPTTMLDATTQMDICQLMLKIQRENNMAIWLITHDFGVVSLMADWVVIMYAGTPVESADRKTILLDPKHPYTLGLINSVPTMGSRAKRLSQIPGEPPDLRGLTMGCSFAPRCPKVMDHCRSQEPPSIRLAGGAVVKCWLYADGVSRG
jgi:oligopeptide/dipeptide ABC transporter ATP-binding protein